MLGLSFALGGVQLHLDFMESAAAASEGIFFTRISYTFEVTLYAIGMYLGAFPWVDTSEAVERIMHTPPAVALLGKILAVSAILWMCLATRRIDARYRLPAQIFLLALIINCFGPLGWTHYFLPIVLMLPGLIGLMDKRAGIALCLTFFLITMSPSQIAMRVYLVEEIPVVVIHVALMTLLFVAILIGLRCAPKAL